MEALFGTDHSSRDGCRGEQFDRVYDEGGSFWQLDQQIGNAQVELSIALDASTKAQELDAVAGRACRHGASSTRHPIGPPACSRVNPPSRRRRSRRASRHRLSARDPIRRNHLGVAG